MEKPFSRRRMIENVCYKNFLDAKDDDQEVILTQCFLEENKPQRKWKVRWYTKTNREGKHMHSGNPL